MEAGDIEAMDTTIVINIKSRLLEVGHKKAHITWASSGIIFMFDLDAYRQ
jgi:hypothetical protein